MGTTQSSHISQLPEPDIGREANDEERLQTNRNCTGEEDDEQERWPPDAIESSSLGKPGTGTPLPCFRPGVKSIKSNNNNIQQKRKGKSKIPVRVSVLVNANQSLYGGRSSIAKDFPVKEIQLGLINTFDKRQENTEKHSVIGPETVQQNEKKSTTDHIQGKTVVNGDRDERGFPENHVDAIDIEDTAKTNIEAIYSQAVDNLHKLLPKSLQTEHTENCVEYVADKQCQTVLRCRWLKVRGQLRMTKRERKECTTVKYQQASKSDCEFKRKNMVFKSRGSQTEECKAFKGPTILTADKKRTEKIAEKMKGLQHKPEKNNETVIHLPENPKNNDTNNMRLQQTIELNHKNSKSVYQQEQNRVNFDHIHQNEMVSHANDITANEDIITKVANCYRDGIDTASTEGKAAQGILSVSDVESSADISLALAPLPLPGSPPANCQNGVALAQLPQVPSKPPQTKNSRSPQKKRGRISVRRQSTRTVFRVRKSWTLSDPSHITDKETLRRIQEYAAAIYKNGSIIMEFLILNEGGYRVQGVPGLKEACWDMDEDMPRLETFSRPLAFRLVELRALGLKMMSSLLQALYAIPELDDSTRATVNKVEILLRRINELHSDLKPLIMADISKFADEDLVLRSSDKQSLQSWSKNLSADCKANLDKLQTVLQPCLEALNTQHRYSYEQVLLEIRHQLVIMIQKKEKEHNMSEDDNIDRCNQWQIPVNKCSTQPLDSSEILSEIQAQLDKLELIESEVRRISLPESPAKSDMPPKEKPIDEDKGHSYTCPLPPPHTVTNDGDQQAKEPLPPATEEKTKETMFFDNLVHGHYDECSLRGEKGTKGSTVIKLNTCKRRNQSSSNTHENVGGQGSKGRKKHTKSTVHRKNNKRLSWKEAKEPNVEEEYNPIKQESKGKCKKKYKNAKNSGEIEAKGLQECKRLGTTGQGSSKRNNRQHSELNLNGMVDDRHLHCEHFVLYRKEQGETEVIKMHPLKNVIPADLL